MIQLSEEQLNNLNKEALVILVASLQNQLSIMKSQLDTANAQLSENNHQIEVMPPFQMGGGKFYPSEV